MAKEKQEKINIWRNQILQNSQDITPLKFKMSQDEVMLFCIKTEKEEHSALNVKTVQKINVNDYMAGQDFWQLGEIAKYRTRALSQLDRYLKYLTRIQASQEYINTISEIEKRVFDLTIKAKDLKQIKFKL